MAILTPPSKGAPVDIELLASMVTEINSLRTDISGNSTSLSSINQKQVSTFGSVAFYAEKHTVQVQKITADMIQAVAPFGFGANGVQFSGIPVVTVSVRNVGNTEGGLHTIPIIKTLTESGCDVSLVFKKADEQGATIEVSIIAIGISV